MIYIVLLHYPVKNRKGKVVATSIANMDISDIARVAKTYGVARYYIVNPVAQQRDLACEIVAHWLEGYGASFNPLRKEAFELVHVCCDLEEVIRDIEAQAGSAPKTVVTSASLQGGLLSYEGLKEMLRRNDLPYLLIFGTGSGIAGEIVLQADYRLEPIKGVGDYNHLSVRSAVAIVLDRLSDRT